MRYLSVCSGIEAATVAWHPLGWTPVAFSEVDAFPSAVLAHHYPTVPNYGDMTKFQEWPDAAIDVLVGGTPCQSFSVAGLRAGLDDPRGNLMLVYLALARRTRPRWLVWENVPGVLSSNNGRDFGTFLGGLAALGYGFAYRVLDAQYFGLAQRRKRVFVVACLGDWRRAAAVLFERASLSGHPAPRREAGQVAPTVPSRRTAGGGLGTDFDCDGGVIHCAAVSSGRGYWNESDIGATVRAQDSANKADTLIASTGDISHCLNAGGMGRIDYETETLIAHSLKADGFDASEDGPRRGTPLVPTYVQDLADPLVAKEGGTYTHEGSGNFRTRNVTAVTVNIYGGGQRADRPEGGFYAKVEPTSKALDASSGLNPTAHQGGTAILQAVAIRTAQTSANGHGVAVEVAHTLDQAQGQAVAIGLDEEQNATIDGMGCLKARREGGGFEGTVMTPAMAVRRLTPRECARLQGFPDTYLDIPYRGKPAADGPKYKALGNSFAVPVVRWIGQRIQMVEDITNGRS